VRLVLANVYKNNSEPVAQQVGPMLDALQPALGGRILVAVEGPRAMATALNGVQGGQVFAWTPAERSAGNIVIWTDLLARDSGMIPLAPIRSPAMFVDFDGEDGPWRLLVVHPFKPLPATAFAHWRSVLEAVADTVAASPYPVVLVGDFNGAPIDFRIRRVLAAGGLLRPPGPALGSWPQPLAAVGVSIDHCFAQASIAVGPARPLTVPGSDHRGLVWEISP
jgi:endonuclease/exonuclease/phosphatase family metal-dependent hydrolase